MGASFQAPHAAPRQRQMETSSWIDIDGLFIAHYNTMRWKKIIIIIKMTIFGSKKNKV